MKAYAELSDLNVSLDNGVMRIVLSHAAGNAVSPAAHGQLGKLFRLVAEDEDVRLVLLTGEGEFAFSLGGALPDMQAALDDPSRWVTSMLEARELIRGIIHCDKPVVARVNGHAIGLGATIALCSDISCMVEAAKIGDPHVKLGLAAGDGAAILWPALIGLARAKRHLLTGDPLTGSQAAELGLVTEAVAAGDLDARVDHWIAKLLALPQLSLRLTKRALNSGLRAAVEAQLDGMLGMETLSFLSSDHRACVEKEVARLSGAGAPPAHGSKGRNG